MEQGRARARAELCNEASEQHAEDIVKIMKHSIVNEFFFEWSNTLEW